MVFEHGDFGRWLGDNVGVLTNGISAFIKQMPESELTPPVMYEHSKKTIYESRRFSPDIESTSSLIMHFAASRTMRNKFILFIIHSIDDTVIVAQVD